MTTTIPKPLTVAIATVSLVGCFSSSSSSDGTGSLSLDVTDAPVDSLEEVNIAFTGITLNPRNGDRIEITLDEEQLEDQPINMLELQRGNAASLISDEEVPAGEYAWVRFDVDESRMSVLASDGSHDLTVNSARGLQLSSGFTIPQGGSADFTIDFDLRAAITNPQSEDQGYFLRPSLRIIDNTEVGAIQGTVYSEVLDACDNATEYAGAVYVFEGEDVIPFDYSDERSPLMSANVDYEEGGEASYKAAFLSEGDYTIAYTCDPDDPEGEPEELNFHVKTEVTVVAGETQREDFDGSNQ